MKKESQFNEGINTYYSKEINEKNLKEEDLKKCLDKMNAITGLDENIAMDIDINKIIEKGQEIRVKRKLKIDTLKFSLLAAAISLVVGGIALKTSFILVCILQFIMIIVLLTINIITLNNSVREEL